MNKIKIAKNDIELNRIFKKRKALIKEIKELDFKRKLLELEQGRLKGKYGG